MIIYYDNSTLEETRTMNSPAGSPLSHKILLLCNIVLWQLTILSYFIAEYSSLASGSKCYKDGNVFTFTDSPTTLSALSAILLTVIVIITSCYCKCCCCKSVVEERDHTRYMMERQTSEMHPPPHPPVTFARTSVVVVT